jgi:hypothetical protein
VAPPARPVAQVAADDAGTAADRRIASTPIEVLAVAALTMLAVGVRPLGHLLTHPFWLDESWVADSTRAAWRQLRLVTSSTPIGWTVLLRAVPRWGDAERYRVLPLAFAAACVVPAWCLGRQLRKPPAGRARGPEPERERNRWRLSWVGWLTPALAGLAAALAPTALDYLYLKQYTAEAFVSLLLIALLAWVERGWSLRRLAILAPAAAVLFLVANTAPLITAAVLGGLGLRVLVRREWSRLAWLAAAGAVVGAVDLLLYRTFVAASNSAAMQRYWRPWYIMATGDWHSAVDRAAHTTAVTLTSLGLGPWPIALALILAGTIALWRAGMLAAALVVPLTFVEMLVAALTRHYPYLEPRTSMFLTVPATVVGAIGLASVAGLFLRWRRTAVLGLAAIIGIGAVFLPTAILAAKRRMAYEDGRDQISLYRDLRRPGDVVLLGSQAAYTFAYYWGQQPTFERALPSSTSTFRVAYPDEPDVVVAENRSPRAAREAIDRLPPGTRRAWIILLHEDNLIPAWVWSAGKHGGRLLAAPGSCGAFSSVELARAGLPPDHCPLLVQLSRHAA